MATEIERPADVVYDYIRDYRSLPAWAAGLSAGVHTEDGVWFSESPMGRVAVAFVPDNPWGVCDHDVTLPDGTVVTNPLRVITDGGRCQVVFTVTTRGGSSDIAQDVRLVQTDLDRLKAILERKRAPRPEAASRVPRSQFDFYVHRTAPAWRLVLASGRTPPPEFV
ncbi:MAG TPA: GNAT family N-acetyltransferase, partial [Mycobacteriales bacterium]